MSRSPLVVLCVVAAFTAVFALCTTVLVRREERRDGEREPRPGREPLARPHPAKPPRVRTAKPPRVRTSRKPRVQTVARPDEPVPPEPDEARSVPDPRRPSYVDDLDAFIEIRSR